MVSFQSVNVLEAMIKKNHEHIFPLCGKLIKKWKVNPGIEPRALRIVFLSVEISLKN